MSCPAYQIHHERFDSESLGFAEAVAAAHANRHRPLCLCVAGGLEMYVARLGDTFILKRMPNTGSDHAPDCPSYGPQADISGLGQVLGSAIKEDPVTGLTSLKLGFRMSKSSGRSVCPTAAGEETSVASDGTRLTLRGLLHYLWDEAGLTRWQPGFAGRRSWAMVRKHLLEGAENKVARGEPLRDRLYVPEVFSVERREAINSRRIAECTHGDARAGSARSLMLVVAEVKGIVQARYGFKAVLKHVPDQAFGLDPVLYRRMTKRFDGVLSLWNARDDLHMVMIATFENNDAGVPAIEELSLMPTSREWIPVEDGFELSLVGALVAGGRRFLKALRYNAAADALTAAAVLLDAESEPRPLYISSTRAPIDTQARRTSDESAAWVWHVAKSPMPALPAIRVCAK
jgi:hypothetical protein